MNLNVNYIFTNTILCIIVMYGIIYLYYNTKTSPIQIVIKTSVHFFVFLYFYLLIVTKCDTHWESWNPIVRQLLIANG
jgi:hypothetical protein